MFYENQSNSFQKLKRSFSNIKYLDTTVNQVGSKM
jgi:hypothetical protein